MSFLFATSSLVGLKRCPRLLHIGQTAHTASISSRYRRIHTSSVGAGPPATTAGAGFSLQEVDAAVPEAAIQSVNQSPNLVSKLLSLSSDGFLALPHTLGIASYAVTIVLLTLLLRCSITVPVTIWQRKRVKRVQDLVVPAAKQWLASAKYSLRAEYRRAGKSYEEYVAALNAKVYLAHCESIGPACSSLTVIYLHRRSNKSRSFLLDIVVDRFRQCCYLRFCTYQSL